jgi:hypothetical protein
VATDVHPVLLVDEVPAEPALSQPIEHQFEDTEATETPNKEKHLLTTMFL